MKRTAEINGLEAYSVFKDRKAVRVRAYDDGTARFWSRDAWKVTPRQRRRFVKRMHQAGFCSSGSGFMRKFGRCD